MIIVISQPLAVTEFGQPINHNENYIFNKNSENFTDNTISF